MEDLTSHADETGRSHSRGIVEQRSVPSRQVWYREEDPAVETLFRTIAERRINSGEAAEVTRICRQLIAESPRRSVNADLTALALQAERALQASAHPK